MEIAILTCGLTAQLTHTITWYVSFDQICFMWVLQKANLNTGHDVGL